MTLKDELEKFRQAELWLKENKPSSQEYQAAWEHVLWLRAHTHNEVIKPEVQRVYEEYKERSL